MITLVHGRGKPGSRLAFLLVYFIAGALGGVAHGRERLDAPVRIESTRHERCPTIHDASACALCSYSHASATATTDATTAIPVALPRHWRLHVDDRVFRSAAALTLLPRGPPLRLA
jgi:hypothetical protein